MRSRTPVIRQERRADCGLACLAMVLAHHGRDVSVRELEEDCRSDRDGVSALALGELAERHGLRFGARRVEPGDLAKAPVPCILHWQLSHFVVLERVDRKGAWIVDPATGRRRADARELDECFTGVTLLLEPGADFERRAAQSDGVRRAMARRALSAQGVRRLVWQVIGASAVLSLLGLAVPFGIKLVVDVVLPGGLRDTMTLLALAIAAVGLAQLVAGVLRAALLTALQARIDRRLAGDFVEHLLGLPYRFFQGQAAGDLLNRLTSNVAIREALGNQTLGAIVDGVMVLSYLVVLALVAPQFALVVGVLGALLAALLALTFGYMGRIAREGLRRQGESESLLFEVLSGVETVKSTGSERRMLRAWAERYDAQIAVDLRSRFAGGIVQAITTALLGIAPLVVLWVGTREALLGQLSLGAVMSSISLASLFLAPLARTASAVQQLQTVGGHLDRLAAVLAEQPERDDDDAVRRFELRGELELRDARFAYRDDGPPALAGVSLRAEPGERVAIVGPSGSGKSTLLRLVLGLLDPDQGEVLLDGRPRGHYAAAGLRARVGVVLQEPFLFQGSIRENLAFGSDDLPLPELRQACALAGVLDDIETMPMGFDTRVGEGGLALSGGQRQRLCLARALVGRPALLVLDEATSHLDAVTERRVNAALAGLGCTRLVVAHRLSTVADADRIVVLDQGCVVEQGTHDELLRAGGTYAELAAAQRTPAAA